MLHRRLLLRLDAAGHRPGRGPDGLAHRAAAHRPHADRCRLGQRPGGLGPAGFRGLRRPGARRRRRLPVDGPGARVRVGRVGGGLRAVSLHHRTARRGLAGPVAAPGRRLFATRSRDVPAHRGDPAHRHRRPRLRLRLRRAHLPPLRGRGSGRRVAQLLVSRRAVRADGGPDRHGGRRAAQRHRRPAPLVRAGTRSSSRCTRTTTGARRWRRPNSG